MAERKSTSASTSTSSTTKSHNVKSNVNIDEAKVPKIITKHYYGFKIDESDIPTIFNRLNYIQNILSVDDAKKEQWQQDWFDRYTGESKVGGSEDILDEAFMAFQEKLQGLDNYVLDYDAIKDKQKYWNQDATLGINYALTSSLQGVEGFNPVVFVYPLVVDRWNKQLLIGFEGPASKAERTDRLNTIKELFNLDPNLKASYVNFDVKV